MKKILILCAPDPNTNPRPNRMIHWLTPIYNLTVVGGEKFQSNEVHSFSLFRAQKLAPNSFIGIFFSTLSKYTYYAFRYLFYLFSQRYEDILWKKYSYSKEIGSKLANEDFDLIISHDIVLMPLAFAIKGKKKAKIMLDAREFYPRNFDDNLRWRILTKPINEHLCDKYLLKCDRIVTVSDGLAKEYAKEYNIPEPDVLMSLPYAVDTQPSPVQEDHIKLIHHGNANSSRKTEVMVEMMDFVDERFSLDLMLVNKKSDRYWQKLNKMAQERKNVCIIPPVDMKEIALFTNAYDIGLYLTYPKNFNVEYMLPNKFFEFIQARLAVAIGPSIEMSKLVKQYDCGIVSKDFSPQSLAQELNQLSTEKITYYKEQSHKAAQILNAETNKTRILSLVEEMLIE